MVGCVRVHVMGARNDEKVAPGGNRGKEESQPQQPPPQDEKWQDMGLASRARFVYDNCTVEPMFGCYILTSMLTGLATQNLNLQKACRVNLGLGESVCSALDNRNASADDAGGEIAVQQLVADQMIWKTIIQSGIPSVLIMFIGSWSDRNRKRKPCMLVPVVGELMSTIGLMLCVYFFDELPMEVTGLVESLPSALTGGWMTMVMAVFSYIGDVSTVSPARPSRGWIGRPDEPGGVFR